MMTEEQMPDVDYNDAELVAECLAGGRDAFGRIVGRYQSLICSLAYCATGSLSQSEDLAQETFITAWKQLPELREPAKLRPWLCAIARNLIGKALRRDRHEPAHAAQSLEAAHDSAAAEPLPADHMISEEEKAILWRSIERIPEIYREPLVLFYRQHQSVEKVAAALDLTEDTVRQRLSRGRKLLHEQVLAFVEGALENTNPSSAFTIGVLAALPLLASTAKVAGAATAGTAAVKSSASAKAATGVAALGALLTSGVLFYVSFLGLLVFLGGCIGCIMSRAIRQSPRQLEYVTRFWRTITTGFAVFVVLPLLLVFTLGLASGSHPRFYEALTLWMELIYLVVPAALVIWLCRWWRESVRPGTEIREAIPTQKRFFLWLSLGIFMPFCLFLLCVHSIDKLGSTPWRLLWFLPFVVVPAGVLLFVMRLRARGFAEQPFDLQHQGKTEADKTAKNAFRAFATAIALALLAPVIYLGLVTCWSSQKISLTELPKILAEYKFARFQVWQYDNGSRELQIFPHNCRTGPFVAPANEQTLALLAESGIPYRTIVQGRDYGYNSPKPWLALGLMVLLTSGAVFLLSLAIKGTIIGTFAFGAWFLAVFMLVLGVSLFQVSAYPKIFVSTARVKVSEWTHPTVPNDEKTVVTSRPVLEQAKALGQGTPWVEILPVNQGGVIELSVNNPTPSGAAAQANAIATAYCAHRNQGPMVAQILDQAVPDPKPFPFSIFKMQLVLRALAGVLLGLVVGVISARIVAARKMGKRHGLM